MRSVITGSGIALPPLVVTNERLSRIMDTSDEWIRTRSGIEQRYYAEPGVGSAELGSVAAERAIRDAGLKPEDIDVVIFATMTPDHVLPGNGPLLQKRVGLRGVPTFDIRQQCSGFLYGLDLADSLLRSGKFERVLLVGAETHSGFMPWDQGWKFVLGLSDQEPDEAEKQRNTTTRDRTVLFGDAAGAVVVERRDGTSGLLRTRLYTDGDAAEALTMHGASFKQRPFVTKEQVETLETVPVMNGREVFKTAVTLMPEAVRAVCADEGVAVEELDLVLVHQANLRIIEGVQKQLGLPAEKVPHNIERYGNTTAATLALLFHECREKGLAAPGRLIAFTALGSGLHWGAALYRM